MKIHLACGDIYLLPDYINVDIKGKLISEVAKKELEKNSTTVDKYFKFPFGTPRRDVIVDKKMDITKPWDFKNESVKEIIAISVIEHVFQHEAQFIISEVKRVLKPQGIFIVDFPDIKQTVLQYIDTDPKLAMRLIYCNGKDTYSLHRNGFTFQTFKELLGNGWDVITQDTIIQHSYPMTGVIAIKK